MKIFVGNLAYDITEEELRKEFLAFGKVDSVSIITDKATGRSKGFAFVEMPAVPEGRAAITALNGKSIKDRALTVNAAKAREERGSSSYGDRKGPGGFGGKSRRRY